jgi:hypothetical protein
MISMISGITIGLAISLECEPKRRHHRHRPRPSTMPLLAFIRKDTGWRIDWQIRPLDHRFGQPDPETLLLWRYRGQSGRYPGLAHAIVVKGLRYIAS